MMMVMGAVVVGVAVLLLPMLMAGWHLSRNKALFFGGAFFISLALLIHLAPHFPSSMDLAAFHSSSSSDASTSCLALLHADVVWTGGDGGAVPSSWRWASKPTNPCSFRILPPSDASLLLNEAWIVIAGDSQARLLSLSLISLLLDNRTETDLTIRPSLFKRHSDYHLAVPTNGARIDFVWAPYPSNLTSYLTSLRSSRLYPDLLVLTSGLWHMLHYSDASAYARSLLDLRDALFSLMPLSPAFGGGEGPVTGSVEVEAPRMFWMGMPGLVTSMLNTEEKRRRMGPGMWAAYDREVGESRLLRGQGGLLFLLDMALLSRGCGVGCTADGMHYDRLVYDAALHIMLNALLIQSHQQQQQQ